MNEHQHTVCLVFKFSVIAIVGQKEAEMRPSLWRGVSVPFSLILISTPFDSKATLLS